MSGIVELVAELAQVLGVRFLYVTGGAVRNYPTMPALGDADIDISTHSPPEDIYPLLKKAKLPIKSKNSLTLGSFSFEFKGIDIDMTSFRGERYTPGNRRPTTFFNASLDEDMARRDFTINACYLRVYQDGKTKFITHENYAEDLEDRCLADVNPARDTFFDDPYRILRLVRQGAQLDYGADLQTIIAARRNVPMLATISHEKASKEIISARNYMVGKEIKAYWQNSLLWSCVSQFIPELHSCEPESGIIYSEDYTGINSFLANVVASIPHSYMRAAIGEKLVKKYVLAFGLGKPTIDVYMSELENIIT